MCAAAFVLGACQPPAASPAELGDPTSETVSPEGFRVFVWEGGKSNTYLTMYAHGVRVVSTAGTAKELVPTAP